MLYLAPEARQYMQPLISSEQLAQCLPPWIFWVHLEPLTVRPGRCPAPPVPLRTLEMLGRGGGHLEKPFVCSNRKATVQLFFFFFSNRHTGKSSLPDEHEQTYIQSQ